MDIYTRKQGYFQQIFTNEKELILVDLCPRKLADFQMISALEIDEIFSRFLAKKINWISTSEIRWFSMENEGIFISLN